MWSNELLGWIGFNLFVVAMLAVDLIFFNRKAHVISFKEAMSWSAVWISLALVFCGGLFFVRGGEVALEFLTGYLIEKSLSVDNLFVFLMVFSYFAVPPQYQQRVLLWGVLGALFMRGTLIVVGAALIHQFHWIIYVFGAFLLVTGFRMAIQPSKELRPEHNPVVRLVRKLMPVTPEYHDGKFFVKQAGRWIATPLFLALVVVEFSDLIFAVDSIPAIFAVTDDPFIVYTSNVFAIMGLRALYFALAGVMDRFTYFKYGLAAVLAFVGVKMLIADFYKIPSIVAFGVIVAILTTAGLASRFLPPCPIVPPDDPAPKP